MPHKNLSGAADAGKEPTWIKENFQQANHNIYEKASQGIEGNLN